jgi:hypothetical protein
MLLPCVKCDGPVERFHTFVQIQNCTAEGLASVLKQELAHYELGQKLIAQSYNGTAVFSGEKNVVRVKMKDVLSHEHLIHCYAHQLNLVMK